MGGHRPVQRPQPRDVCTLRAVSMPQPSRDAMAPAQTKQVAMASGPDQSWLLAQTNHGSWPKRITDITLAVACHYLKVPAKQQQLGLALRDPASESLLRQHPAERMPQCRLPRTGQPPYGGGTCQHAFGAQKDDMAWFCLPTMWKTPAPDPATTAD